MIGIMLVVALAACTTTSGQERGRVYCPECGTDFDAIYQKRF